MRQVARWGMLAVLALCLVLLTLPGPARAGGSSTYVAGVVAQQPVYHVVQPGDTLFWIAVRYGTTVPELVRLNNLANPNWIYVGQRLLIRGGAPAPAPTPPPAPTPSPQPGGNRVHTVRPGDSVYGIAALYGVTAQSIIQANNLVNPNLIYVGQQLIIPGTGGPNPNPTPNPNPSPSGMQWGIQAQVFGQDAARVDQALSTMNLQWVKQQIRWSEFEPSPGTIQWGSIDTVVDSVGGRQLLLSVLAAPDWARPAGTDPNVVGPPADPATYARFVGALAGRYCGKVGAIEVWNEQNLAREWGNQSLDAVQYMNLLKAAYPAIKAACPGTVVVSGALTPTGAPAPAAVDDFTFLTQMYQNGLRQASDAVGVHPSGYNIPPDLYFNQACNYIQQTNTVFRGPCNTPHHSWTFRSTLEGTRNIMVQWGDGGKKLWVTEFGWAVGGNPPAGYEYARDNTREEQAAWTAQAFSVGRNSGYVGAMFLWNLNFADVASGSEQALWSVYDAGYTPTITVPAVRDTPH